MVDLSRDMIVQRLVQSFTVVKLKILARPVPGLTYLMVIVQIDLSLLNSQPEIFCIAVRYNFPDIGLDKTWFPV